MRYLLGFFLIVGLWVGSSFALSNKRMVQFNQNIDSVATSSVSIENKKILKNEDIEPQKPLANPPETIKAVYATSWSAVTPSKIEHLIKLIKETELNAIVIDIKDFSGYVSYDIKLPEIEKYKAKEVRIKKINALIKRLHDENIYVIARITIFQDPVLAKARPDLAIHSKKSGGLWLDHKKLSWIDPAAKETWDYNIAIAKDAANRGFDELNFDYIRFASDGNLNDMKFPFYDEKTLKSEVMASFFKYLREQLPETKISADLFGLTTINNDDSGIGQIIEKAYQYFDYVAPMVYPSHYAVGTLGYKNPASYPYEIVKYSMGKALQRLAIYNQELTTSTSTSLIKEQNKNQLPITNYQLRTKLRPWLQDFDLGADYDAAMVRKQIKAVYDAASSTPELIDGFMLWDPRNEYTKGALQVGE